jgi:hypothetical protein
MRPPLSTGPYFRPSSRHSKRASSLIENFTSGPFLRIAMRNGGRVGRVRQGIGRLGHQDGIPCSCEDCRDETRAPRNSGIGSRRRAARRSSRCGTANIRLCGAAARDRTDPCRRFRPLRKTGCTGRVHESAGTPTRFRSCRGRSPGTRRRNSTPAPSSASSALSRRMRPSTKPIFAWPSSRNSRTSACERVPVEPRRVSSLPARARRGARPPVPRWSQW